MSEHRQRIDPITAEHLVRGARAGMHGRDPLAELLAAAASPARRDELAGEEDAVLAFRAANLARPPASRRRSMLSIALAKLATAKVAIAVVAVGGGGIALAAGSGKLPGVGDSSHHPTAGAGPSAGSSHRPTSAGSSGASHSRRSAPPGSSSHAASQGSTPAGSPTPNLRGLCTAYTARVGENPGKALENPAFSVLIKTAGGKEQVASYCATLLGAAPSTHASDHPSGHGAPTTRPSHGQPSHPAGGKAPGRPTAVPPTTPAR